MANDSLLWTFEAAYNAMVEGGSLGQHTVDALDGFLKNHFNKLLRCYNPVQRQSAGTKLDDKSTKLRDGSTIEGVDEKCIKDAKEFSELIDIDPLEALHIVLWFDRRGIFKDDQRQLDYLRFYLSERRFALKIVAELFLVRGMPKYEGTPFGSLMKRHSTEILAADGDNDFFPNLLKHIQTTFTTELPELEDDKLNKLYMHEESERQLLLLNLLYQALITVVPSNSSALFTQWLDYCKEAQFFSTDSSTAALAMMITVGFLDIEQDFSTLEPPEGTYFTDPKVMQSIHKTLSRVNTKETSPILLTYGIVLLQVAIRLESNPDPKFDGFVQTVGMELNDMAAQCVERSLHLGVIEYITSVFNDAVLPESIDYVSTMSSVLQAALPYVTLNDTMATAINACVGKIQAVSTTFFSDPFANRALMLVRAKVPLSVRPFLQLAQALGSDAFEYLFNMTTFMQELPRTFKAYEFDSGKPSLVHLTSSLDLYDARQNDGQGGIVLQPGASGEIISSGNSTVVMWNLKYNGWSFLGRIIEQEFLNLVKDGLTGDVLKLVNETLSKIDEQRGIELLDSLSEGLRPGTDIVELVTKLLDESMYTRNVEMCILGVDFLTELTPIMPQKVWPYIGRSKLLGHNGGGHVATILGAVEIVQCQYDFTISVIKLVNVLITDATAKALDNSISQRIKSEALTKFIRHLVDVFESFAYWRYSDARQRVEIASLILGCFTEVLFSNYRVDNDLTTVLHDGCKVITSQFLDTSESCLRTLQPLLGAFESVARNPLPLDITSRLRQDEFLHTDASLKFCSLIIRVRSMLKLPISMLEKRLFIHSPDLARIFMRYNALHAPVVDLLEGMVSGYCESEFDQPSLLAHLGTEYSQMLITGLSTAVQNDLELDNTIGNICSYFSSILLSQQEGLSILLLSGEDTRNTHHKVESVDSLLTVLEDRIAVNSSLPPSLLDQILDCIALANSNWNTNKKMVDKPKFVKALLDVVDRAFKIDEIPEDHFEVVETASTFAMAAKAVKIFAVQAYKGYSDHLKPLTDKIEEYSAKFLRIIGFRPSLHQHLARNFENKYGVGLSKFVKSSLVSTCNKKLYGISYMYDMWLLDTLMGNSYAWDDGYRNEVIEANVNLSLVDAQITMVHGWCSFVSALVPKLSSSARCNVAVVAATINNEQDSTSISLPIFQSVLKHRLDMCFYALHESKADLKLKVQDLEVMFNLLVNVGFLTPEGDHHSQYKLYRQLLKIINVALDGFKTEEGFQLQQLIHQILDAVVIRGMSTICTNSSSMGFGSAEDIIQITTILRKCLRVPGLHSIYGTLTLQMADSGCDRLVMSLFSNCTEMYNTEEEAVIYGELALLYMLEWLTVDNMADQFVIDGVFSVLLEAPIAKYIQQGEVRFDSPYFGIWTNGILTLVLELLKHLGSRIVPEVLVFMGFYEPQIRSTLTLWTMLQHTPDLTVALSTINETSQLVLLYDIITKLCEADQVDRLPRDGIPGSGDMVEALDYLLSHQKFLASRVVATEQIGSDELMDRAVSELQDLRELLE